MKKAYYLKIAFPIIIIYLLISCNKDSPTESIPLPDTPQGISAYPGDCKVTISWDSVLTATSYDLYWSTTPGVTPTTGTQIPNVSNPYTHIGLTNYTTYYYIVVAVNSGGEGSASAEVSATPGPPPDTPTLYEIFNPDGIWDYTINWSAVNQATVYTLEEDSSDMFNNPTILFSGTEISTSIIDKSIGTYYYRVKASNTFGSSPWSNVVFVQVTEVEIIPEPGTWSDNSSGITVRFTVSSDSKTVSNGRITVSCGSKSISGTATIEYNSFILIHSDSINFISATFTDVDKARGSYGIFRNLDCWAFGTTTYSH